MKFLIQLLLLIFSVLLIIFFTPIALVVFPGVIIFFTMISYASFSERLFYSIAFSLAFWIVGFSFLKFVPFQLSSFVIISLVLSCGTWCYQIITGKLKKITIEKADVFWILVIGIASYFMLQTYLRHFVAAGADMATHTYTARVIFDANKFPTTHEPLVPIDTFGFAPYGLSVLSALISLFTELPVYRSSFLVVMLAYPFLAGAFYLFLKNYVSSPAIFAVIVLLFAFEENIATYLRWGGNTTILALGFVAVGISWLIFCIQKNYLNKVSLLVNGILLAASFYTHQTPLVIVGTLIGCACLYVVYKKQTELITHFLYLFGLLLVLLLPFLFSMQLLTTSEVNHIKTWQQNKEYFAQAETPLQIFPAAVRNILYFHSERLLWLLILGISVSLWRRSSHFQVYSASLVLLLILLFNVNFWVLPLSQLFYPDRVLTLALIPFAYFIAQLFDFIKGVTFEIYNHKNKLAFAFLMIWFISLGWLAKTRFEHFFNVAVLGENYINTSVTEDDMNVFNWISTHTLTAAIIANNYGDAGVWIPAIAGRKITDNDFNAHYLSEIEATQMQLKPDYIYLGNKMVYGVGSYTFERIATDSAYQLVFSSGDAKLYKILR